MSGPIESAALAALPGVRHGFFTREGGVSEGIYQSLNCGLGSADDHNRILENRARVAAMLGCTGEAITTTYQVHGKEVAVAAAPWDRDTRPKADGVVTDRPGLALAIGTADCGPILLADAEARVIGAAHAGWRGTLAGIAEATVAAMETLGARRARIVAVLGPTISQPNYEVGDEVLTAFTANDAEARRFFVPAPRANHYLFDLPAAIVARLAAAGVNGSALHRCTYAEPERFFSYRRATHMREPDYGRLLSAIMLTG